MSIDQNDLKTLQHVMSMSRAQSKVTAAKRELDAAAVAYGMALAEEHEAQAALPVGKQAQDAVVAAVKAYNAARRALAAVKAEEPK